MFNIENHCLIRLYGTVSNNFEWFHIIDFSCCDLDVHSFKNEQFVGVADLGKRGQLDAVFEFHQCDGKPIYALISIENVREFASCKTVKECQLAYEATVSSSKLAA